VNHAGATPRAVMPAAGCDPDVAVAVDALDSFWRATGTGRLPDGLYANLRVALADLELPPDDFEPPP